VAISKAEQQRVVIKGTLFTLPAIGVAIVLTITLGEEMTSWAEDWPSGPAGFIVMLGLVSAVSLLLVCVACLVYAWPERTPPRLRISTATRLAFAWGGGLLTIFSVVPLFAASPRQQGQSRDCDPSGFGCYMNAEHAGAVTAAWVVFFAVCVAGSAILFWVFRPMPGKSG
jgi:hypothetical protein